MKMESEIKNLGNKAKYAYPIEHVYELKEPITLEELKKNYSLQLHKVLHMEENRMKNLFIEYPKCSTCQKAKKWLEENNIEFIDKNIIEETPNINELSEWINKSGLEIRKWFNTSGLKYKELNLKEKIATMSDEEKIKLLASDGMLIKRPILVTDKIVLIGFKEQEWKDSLL